MARWTDGIAIQQYRERAIKRPTRSTATRPQFSDQTKGSKSFLRRVSVCISLDKKRYAADKRIKKYTLNV